MPHDPRPYVEHLAELLDETRRFVERTRERRDLRQLSAETRARLHELAALLEESATMVEVGLTAPGSPEELVAIHRRILADLGRNAG